jgi:hypothetical protein
MKPHLLHAAEALAAALLLGCGGSGSSALGDGNGPQTGAGSSGGRGASGNPDATVSGGDTDAEAFQPSVSDDAGSTIVTQGVCAPGVYRGQFMTYVGAGDDGGSAGGLFSFMWNGNLTIDLAAQKVTMTATSGGEVPTTTSTSTLTISDGGALDGSDMYGGAFFADLNGALDCAPDAGPPYRLTATLSNGSYNNTFFKIPIVGNLTADYQAGNDAGTPPMLVNGGIFVGGIFVDGGTPTSSASGTWSATLVSP